MSFARLSLSRLLVLVFVAPGAVRAQDADRVDVRVSGTILLNTFTTSRRTNNFDLPQFVVRPSAADSLSDGGGMG